MPLTKQVGEFQIDKFNVIFFNGAGNILRRKTIQAHITNSLVRFDLKWIHDHKTGKPPDCIDGKAYNQNGLSL
jgi:hypothetical protein